MYHFSNVTLIKSKRCQTRVLPLLGETPTMKEWWFIFLFSFSLQPTSLSDETDCETKWFDKSPLDHCDIFDDYLTFKFSRLFENLKCIKAVQITIDGNRTMLTNPSEEESIRNRIQDKCKATRIKIRALDKMGKQTRNFFLNPRTCLEQLSYKIDFSFEEIGKDEIGMQIGTKIFKTASMQDCLESAKYESDIGIDMIPDKDRLKVTLDRSKEQTWYMRYKLKNDPKLLLKRIRVPRAGEFCNYLTTNIINFHRTDQVRGMAPHKSGTMQQALWKR